MAEESVLRLNVCAVADKALYPAPCALVVLVHIRLESMHPMPKCICPDVMTEFFEQLSKYLQQAKCYILTTAPHILGMALDSMIFYWGSLVVSNSRETMLQMSFI